MRIVDRLARQVIRARHRVIAGSPWGRRPIGGSTGFARRAGWLSAAVAGFIALAALLLAGGCAPKEAPPPAVHLGMYRYLADAAVFKDCETGISFPVLLDGAHIDVERAYLALEAAGAPVLLAARFEVVPVAPEPGMAPRNHLRVVEFDGFRPAETCPGR